jgi:hypothetical protein
VLGNYFLKYIAGLFKGRHHRFLAADPLGGMSFG